MRSLLIALLGTLFLTAVGCQSDSDKSKMKSGSGDAMQMSGDACAHCPGVQKATAEGKCPLCGMKVSAASKSTSDASMASADVCAACPGVQTATADGKCSACGAQVAKK
jgi:hypothetical protein